MPFYTRLSLAVGCVIHVCVSSISTTIFVPKSISKRQTNIPEIEPVCYRVYKIYHDRPRVAIFTSAVQRANAYGDFNFVWHLDFFRSTKSKPLTSFTIKIYRLYVNFTSFWAKFVRNHVGLHRTFDSTFWLGSREPISGHRMRVMTLPALNTGCWHLISYCYSELTFPVYVTVKLQTTFSFNFYQLSLIYGSNSGKEN